MEQNKANTEAMDVMVTDEDKAILSLNKKDSFINIQIHAVYANCFAVYMAQIQDTCS